MFVPRDIDSYGGLFEDEFPVQNPTTEQSADYAMRMHADVAQMTNTSDKWSVTFPTSSGGAATISAATVAILSHYTSSASAKPVVAKTATGIYTLTFASTYTDELATVDSTSLFAARGFVMHATQFGHVQCVVSGTTVTVYVVDLAGSASDLGGSVTVCVEMK